MYRIAKIKYLLTITIACGALCTGASRAGAANYLQTDLVSNIPGLASVTDPNLVNPWGVAFSATSPFWISNQGTNTSTLYATTTPTSVSKVALTVSIPTTSVGPQGPTGQVFNTNGSSFAVQNGGDGGAARFIFANLNGTISAWDAGTTAFIQATSSGAVYTGLAINQAGGQLYAADNSGASINVFNSSFAQVALGASAFATPAKISALGLAPFNVQDIGGKVYVAYAPAGHAAQAAATPGEGAVAVFSESGALQQTIVGGPLASPWGVALAPSSFGPFGGDLLVGNFSYAASEINAFDPVTGTYLGSIPIDPGAGDTAGGLWALDFGIGGKNGSPDTLYFADGINGEAAGLFGAITSVPEPSTWAMMLLGFLGLGSAGYRKAKKTRVALST